jgi:hypothetical protein
MPEISRVEREGTKNAKIFPAEMIAFIDKGIWVKMSMVHSRDKSKGSVAGLIGSEESSGPFHHIKEGQK